MLAILKTQFLTVFRDSNLLLTHVPAVAVHGKLALVYKAMVWSHQAPSHYLDQWLPSLLVDILDFFAPNHVNDYNQHIVTYL